jgi:putative ABC transport system substrate-binding protein
MERIRIDSLYVNLKSALRNPKFAVLLGAMLLALIVSAEAQQSGKIPRIGYLASGGDINNPVYIVEAFRRWLRDLGYIEGKNIVVEYRYPGADPRDLGAVDVCR